MREGIYGESKVDHRQTPPTSWGFRSDDPRKWGAKCDQCPLNGQEPVWGDGPRDALVAFIGEAPGRDEVAVGIPFCLVPETLVLTGMLEWKPLGDLKVGDEILGVTENGPERPDGHRNLTSRGARRWTAGVVTNVVRRVAEVFQVDTSDGGSIISSADHQFLNGSMKGASQAWVRVDQMQQWDGYRSGYRKLQAESGITAMRSSRLVRPFAPWAPPTGYDFGYLAGFLDGEGHVGGTRGPTKKRGTILGFAQNVGSTLDHVSELFDQLGFKFGRSEIQRVKGVANAKRYLRGGFTEAVKLLGTVRPKRLLSNFRAVLMRDGMGARWASMNRPRVLRRTPLGVREVVDITTTCGTFIANGYVVHNCGRSGRTFENWLTRHNLKRSQVWIDNSILCFPPGGDLKLFLQVARKQHKTEQKGKKKEEVLSFNHPVDCCRPRLMSQLRIPRCETCSTAEHPRYLRGPDKHLCICKSPRILPIYKQMAKEGFVSARAWQQMGNFALESTLGFSGITAHRGYVENMKERRERLMGIIPRWSYAVPELTKPPSGMGEGLPPRKGHK